MFQNNSSRCIEKSTIRKELKSKSKDKYRPVKISESKTKSKSFKQLKRPSKTKPVSTDAQKMKVQTVNEPRVPQKILRVLRVLRHEKFIKLVARYFKPSTWKNSAGLKPKIAHSVKEGTERFSQ